MDIDSITLGDIEEIENYAGLPFGDIGENKPGVAKLRTALVWVLKRKDTPGFTIEDARALSPSELEQLFADDTVKK